LSIPAARHYTVFFSFFQQEYGLPLPDISPFVASRISPTILSIYPKSGFPVFRLRRTIPTWLGLWSEKYDGTVRRPMTCIVFRKIYGFQELDFTGINDGSSRYHDLAQLMQLPYQESLNHSNGGREE
jgi:hypothetical protein